MVMALWGMTMSTHMMITTIRMAVKSMSTRMGMYMNMDTIAVMDMIMTTTTMTMRTHPYSNSSKKCYLSVPRSQQTVVIQLAPRNSSKLS